MDRSSTLTAVVVARMSSSRLPGKSLMNLGGKPLIEHVVTRVARAESVDEIVVATSSHPSDDRLAEFCHELRVGCFRGPLADVAGRVLLAADARSADRFLRISGDSPLIDPSLIDRGASLSLRSGADLVTNVFPRTFPAGQSVEVVRTEAFRRLYAGLSSESHREHVTSGFYAEPSAWRILNFESGRPAPSVSLAVDSAEDLVLMETILERVGSESLSWEALLAIAEAGWPSTAAGAHP